MTAGGGRRKARTGHWIAWAALGGFVIGLAAVLLLTAPRRTHEPAVGPVLRVGLPAPLTRMEPHRLSSVVTLARRLVYPGLSRVEASGEVVPELAERFAWEPDGLALRVTLRRVRLHDGRWLSAEDVIHSLHQIPATIDDNFEGAASAISSIEPAGEREIVIRLHRPAPRLLELLEVGIASPQSHAGAGPYVVAHQDEARIALNAVDGAAVGFPRVEMIAFSSTEELWKRLLTREIDVAPFLTAAGHEALGRHAWLRRWSHPSETAAVLLWSPACRQPSRLREAVDLAIDRARLAAMLRDPATPLASRLDPATPIRYAPDRARWLLARGRRGPDERTRLVLGIMESHSESALIAERLRSDLGRVGVGLEILEVAQQDLGVHFGREDLHLSMRPMGRLPTRSEPGVRRESALFRVTVRSAANARVCGLESGPRTFLPYLDRAYPCPPGAEP